MYYQQPSVRYSGPTQVGPQPGVVGVEYRQLSGGAVPAVSTVTPTVSTVPRTVAPAHSQVQNVQYRNLTTGAISSAPPQVLGTAPVTQNIQNVEYRNLTTGAVSSAPPALSGGTVPTTVPAPPALSGGTVPTTVPGTAPGTTIEKVEYRNLTTGEVTSAHPGASPQNVEYTTPVPATVPSAPAEIYSRPDFGMESELPKLYVQKISCNCLGPWLLLKESGIPFELVVVDITKGDSHTPEFLALNPMGKVPVFVGHDGMVVWESNTIMRYICEKYPVPDHFFPRCASLSSAGFFPFLLAAKDDEFSAYGRRNHCTFAPLGEKSNSILHPCNQQCHSKTCT